MSLFDLFTRHRIHEAASSTDEDALDRRIAEQVNPTMSAPTQEEWYFCLYCSKYALSTLARVEHLCYNRTVNSVLPRRCCKHPRAWMYLIRRHIVSTVAHHAHNGNTPEKRCTGPCQRVLPATTEYFHRERRNTDGLRSECKTCRNHPKDESIPEGYKRCTKCGEVKIASTEYFPRTTHNKEGLSSRCKVCNNALNKAFRENNPEKNKRRMQQWQSTHIEHLREYNQQFKQDNEEYFRSYNRHYRAAHPEQFRARAHKRRALQLGAEGFYTAQDIQAQYQRQRGTCYYCQKRLGKSYHIDHIVPLSRGGANWPDNLVITCPPCNLRKHDKLPHEWAEGGRLLEEVLPYRPLSGASPARGVGSLY